MQIDRSSTENSVQPQDANCFQNVVYACQMSQNLSKRLDKHSRDDFRTINTTLIREMLSNSEKLFSFLNSGSGIDSRQGDFLGPDVFDQKFPTREILYGISFPKTRWDLPGIENEG